MKNIIFILILSISTLFAQDDKGKVTLTFNDELYVIPINSVIIRKENKIIISVRGENSDSNQTKLISMELAYNKLTSEEKNGFDLFNSRIQVSKWNRSNGATSDLILDFRQNGEGYTVRYSKGERIQSNINSVSLRIYDQKITYDEKELVIELSFKGELGSSPLEHGEKIITKIQDCKILIKI